MSECRDDDDVEVDGMDGMVEYCNQCADVTMIFAWMDGSRRVKGLHARVAMGNGGCEPELRLVDYSDNRGCVKGEV